VIADVESSKPPFVVLVMVGTSWLQRQNSEGKIFRWLNGYIDEFYRPVLVAEILSSTTFWHRGEEASHYRARPGSVMVFKRVNR
jgi:hypothetical protein